MGPGWRRIAGLAAIFGVGLAGGELWLRLKLAEGIPVSEQASLAERASRTANGARRTRGASPTVGGPSTATLSEQTPGVAPSSLSPGANRAPGVIAVLGSREPAGPLAAREPAAGGIQTLRQGADGNRYLPKSEWEVSVALPDAATSEERLSQALGERHGRESAPALAEMERALIRRKQLGPPPWGQDRFQVIGSHLRIGAVVGSDFEAPASPEDSLGWYETEARPSVSSGGREEALQLLRLFEVQRREAITRILDTLFAVVQGDRFRTEAVAYAVVNRKLVLIESREIQGLEVLFDRARTLDDKIFDEAAQILR